MVFYFFLIWLPFCNFTSSGINFLDDIFKCFVHYFYYRAFIKKKSACTIFFSVTLASYCLFQMKRFNYSIHLPCGTEQNHSYLYIYIFFRWRNTGCYRMPPGRHQLALISLQKEEIWGLFQSTINIFSQVLSYKCNIKLNHLKLIFIHTYVC